jgi:indole-3-glycerol phosphate synthase
LPETQAARHRDILEAIVATKRREVESLRREAASLRAAAEAAPAARDFRGALEGSTVAVIAEVKRRSPGAGEIRPGLDPGVLAREYESAGASALSVLTDREYFGGSLGDLRAARSSTGLPALRKDFTLDPVQIYEARAAGADAVLLIARILEDGLLRDLRVLAGSLGMAALVEVHTRAELDRAVESGAEVVGVNNRDLRTFTTDLAVTESLLEHLPQGGVLVSESGIRSGEDVSRLGRAGVHSVLVGESILRQDRPGDKVQELAGRPRAERP